MVVVIPGVLDARELANIQRLLGDAPWASGQSAGPQAMAVKKNLQIPEGAEVLGQLRRMVMQALNECPDVVAAALPNKVIPPNFNCYDTDHSYYGWHTDNSVRYLPDGSCLRTDVSATLFLSDPGSYDGGELCIRDTYGEHSIKGEAGSLVLYPSGSLHQVTAVTRGQRLACYLFIQSLVLDTEARGHLYQMDKSLRHLRRELGEIHPEVLALTNLYHNLVRRFTHC